MSGLRVLEAHDLDASYADCTALQGVTCRVEEAHRRPWRAQRGGQEHIPPAGRRAAGAVWRSGHGGRAPCRLAGGPGPHVVPARRARPVRRPQPERALEYVARLHGVDDWAERAAELLDRLGLADRGDDPPFGFSRGIARRPPSPWPSSVRSACCWPTSRSTASIHRVARPSTSSSPRQVQAERPCCSPPTVSKWWSSRRLPGHRGWPARLRRPRRGHPPAVLLSGVWSIRG